LKENFASPRDLAFLEPSGYVGFYSGLKILDYPGLSSLERVAARIISGRRVGAHAPSRLVVAVPRDAKGFSGTFGIEGGAIAHYTDGAEFIVNAISAGGTVTELPRTLLDPVQKSGHRGRPQITATVDPSQTARTELIITSGPHGSNAADCTHWSELEFDL